MRIDTAYMTSDALVARSPRLPDFALAHAHAMVDVVGYL
jgi:hypothetical protein